MAFATLYRFRIEVADIDRGVYESLDLRAAMHPSETAPYLVSRVLAFALNSRPGLEFTPSGLSDPDAPALHVPTPHGGVELWIEIGNPSARRLHKAAKAADEVKVYTYKNPELLIKELTGADVHKIDQIEICSFDPRFLDRLIEKLEKNNSWQVMRNDGRLTVTIGEGVSEEGELRRHHVPI